MRTLLLAVLMSLVSATAFAQITGKVLDADSRAPLPGATVQVAGSQTGTVTGLDGSFTLDVAAGVELTVSFVGYVTQTVTSAANLRVYLESTDISLGEVSIIASVAVDRKTPVAASTVTLQQIEDVYGGSTELPEVLKVTPAVYATKTGGGVGDSRINIRGFDQRNIAVLINGIPVNDMENGWVYWSNWAGLGDAVKTIQVQRGLGASKLAINSIGGTMNIITKSTDAVKAASVQFQTTDYGQNKLTLFGSTGLMSNGFAVSAVFSRISGDGYVDGTWIEGYNYFLSISRQFGDHRLVLTGVGAPQKHGQRTSGITQAKINTQGARFNPDIGYFENGDLFNERVNYYHKPQFALNHYWSIRPQTTLSSSAYFSIGHGGGSGRLGSGWPRKASGLIDIQKAYDYNVANPSASGGGVRYANRNSVNNHRWIGILSTLNHEINENVDLVLGIDARDYKGEHFREVQDLLGGTQYNDRTNGLVGLHPDAGDYLNIFKVVPEDQRVAYDNDGLVGYVGAFGQVEYSKDQLNAFATASLNNTSNQRVERFIYRNSDRSQTSEKVNIFGWSAKAGANLNLNETSNIYANVGAFSRAPFFSFVFVNNSNDVVQNLLNEKALSFEAGYGYTTRDIALKVNAYSTQWTDKSLLSGNIPGPNGSITRALMSGASATHRGFEVEFNTQPLPDLQVGGMLSIGDWKWTGDINATVYSEADPTQSVSVTSYVDGVHVGDAPQSQYGVQGRYELPAGFWIGATYLHNDRFFAAFDPAAKDSPDDKADSWQMPSFSELDARIGYDVNIGGYDASFVIQGFNLLDEFYWSDATDNGSGAMAYGFPGFGRNYNFSAKFRF